MPYTDLPPLVKCMMLYMNLPPLVKTGCSISGGDFLISLKMIALLIWGFTMKHI